MLYQKLIIEGGDLNPLKVVDEIEHYIKNYDVKEFHLEDLNPTVNEVRTKNVKKL